MLARAAIVGVIVTILTVYFIHRVEIPAEDFEHPWRIKQSILTSNVVGYIAGYVEWLHLGSSLNFTRAYHHWTAPPVGAYDVQVTEADFGGVQVLLHVPRAAGVGRVGTGVLYLHGGGWVLFSPENYGPLLSHIAEQTPAVVAAVYYRLAPEHPAPAGLTDCLVAARHFLTHARQYGVHPHKLVIMGDSAGGNLAAVVTMALRDEKFEPTPAAHVLIYPVLQGVGLDTPSYQQNPQGPFLTPGQMAFFFSAYLTGGFESTPFILNHTHVNPVVKEKLYTGLLDYNKLPQEYHTPEYKSPKFLTENPTVWKTLDKMIDPYISPLLANDLRNLPKTYVYTCQHDILRDEGVLYAMRLKEAGNDVTHFNDHVCCHGNMHEFKHVFTEAAREVDKIINYIRTNV